MRHIQLFVPADARTDVFDVLRESGVDYVVTREEGDGTDAVLVHFPIPTPAVDDLLGALRDAGLPADNYTVISNVETARSPNLGELERRYVTGDEGDDTVSAEEIRTKALGMQPDALSYYTMTLLSALVATAGLLLDSPTVVVGSMVIAPQIGSPWPPRSFRPPPRSVSGSRGAIPTSRSARRCCSC